MNDSYLVKIEDDFIHFTPGPVSTPPMVDVYSLAVMEGGDLPPGTYYYAVTAIGINGESAPYNILKVRAPFQSGNTIAITWHTVNSCVEYRIYRGSHEQSFEGFITYYGRSNGQSTFYDSGIIELNISAQEPPNHTPLANPGYSIRKDDVIKVDGSFDKTAEEGPVSVLYICLRDSVFEVNLLDVLNKPTWDPLHKQGLQRAIKDLEKWLKDGRNKV